MGWDGLVYRTRNDACHSVTPHSLIASYHHQPQGRPQRQDPLVLHHQLHHDRLLPRGHGGHDPRPRAAPGHQPLQRRHRRGGRQGGVRVEARARRRLPPAPPLPHGLRGPGRLGRPAPAHGLRHPRLRPPRLPLPRQPRLPRHRLRPPLRLPLLLRRLPLLAPLQDVPRHGLQEEHPRHGLPLPRRHLRHLHDPQLRRRRAGACVRAYWRAYWRACVLAYLLASRFAIYTCVFSRRHIHPPTLHFPHFPHPQGSTLALPVGTFFLLVFLWFGVSIPLVFVGAYFGYKKPAIEHPVRTNIIARGIPPQPWYMHPLLVVIFSGILPFGAVSVELFFIMSAVWLHQYFYLFGPCVRRWGVWAGLYEVSTRGPLARPPTPSPARAHARTHARRLPLLGGAHPRGDVRGDDHRHDLLPGTYACAAFIIISRKGPAEPCMNHRVSHLFSFHSTTTNNNNNGAAL